MQFVNTSATYRAKRKMSSHTERNVQIYVDRLIEAYNLRNEADLARYLDADQSLISAWKRRGNIPEKVLRAKCPELSLDWLYSGVGNKWREEAPEWVTEMRMPPPAGYTTAELAASAQEMERAFAKMTPENQKSLLRLLGYTAEQAEKTVKSMSQKEIAKLAMDLLWLKLGFSVDRRP